MGKNLGFNTKAPAIKEYVLDIGTILVYDEYMVAVFNEGTTLTLERAYQIIGISEIHYRNKPFGYISYRKHSYAIDPIIYTYLRELENLIAFAVVTKKEIDMHNFKIEKMFYKNMMEIFIEFDNAALWIKKRVKRIRNKKALS